MDSYDVARRDHLVNLWNKHHALEQRVARLEGLLTPEQHAQLRLIKQAEHVVDVARAEGQL